MPKRVLLLLLIATLGLRCARNTERAALDEPITPPGTVEREPYLVSVSDTSAVLRWSTFQPAQPGIRLWAEADTTELVLESRGRDHTFQMLELLPATEYTYQIQINDTLWSETASFRTFPVPGSKEPFQFIMFGDSGMLSAGQLALAEHLNQEEPALMIHAGDVAYPDGTEQELTVKHFAVYAPILKRVPFFPSMGDHDLRTRFGEPYIEAFTPPGGRVTSESPHYYSFTYGNVRFISLNSKASEEHAIRFGYLGDPSSDQYQWLLRQLSLARADPGIDWIIVYNHHPPYSASTGFGGHGSDLALRRSISPLLDGYRVPFMFSGHDHDYQRSRPIRGNAIAEDGEGTVYVVSGGGGGRTTFRGTGADWFTEVSQQVYHYVRADVDHYTIRLEAVNLDGNVFDTYEVSIPEDLRKPWLKEAVPLTMPGLEDDETVTGATTPGSPEPPTQPASAPARPDR
ncbi:MAG TPA: metallophosphoesterase family protein [Gemmatimonadota bacterium]|nr:metallophosphoesterase family protein [Gemmatimonadota bacterium]